MRRQFVLPAVASIFLLLQLSKVCDARSTNRENERTSLVKRLRDLIVDKTAVNEDKFDEELAEENREDNEHNSNTHSRYNSRGLGLTNEQKERVITVHNDFRRGENAADMQKLKYNENLARLAQAWADKCVFEHRQPGSFQPKDYGFETVGENIWAWSDGSKKIPDQPIQDWFDEKANYDFNGPSCRKEPCGHYTAVVWATTQEVGCGLAKCNMAGLGPNTHFFVCNYGPAGNDYGTRPYTKGPACSACSTGKFYCTDDLCDASCTSTGNDGSCHCKAKCANGRQTSDCKCQCNHGYMGVACDEVCQDKSPQCNAGWPALLCTNPMLGPVMDAMVQRDCPKMCGHCDSKKREGEELELLEYLKERMAEEKK
jgi:uncharacterized protein YkwD